MRTIICLIATLSFFSCQQKSTFKQHPIYKSISSDSVLYYYDLGWQQIMDEGNYGPAENSYRKALEHDSNFLVGKSVLGRLTLDLEERLKIYGEIQQKKGDITDDEQLILEVYAALVNYTNAREQKEPRLTEIRQDVFKLAENNLGIIAHKYPDEIYLKAEYIEFLHARYGPRNALDSLADLCSSAQKENPFLLGYTASMEAEMDNFELALQHANRLKEIINNENIPKAYAVLADVYFQMDSLERAKINADKANNIDPRNLDVSRLQEKIARRLEMVNY